jgi:hypothetical protein
MGHVMLACVEPLTRRAALTGFGAAALAVLTGCNNSSDDDDDDFGSSKKKKKKSKKSK